jgi:hypothetical protein
MTVTLQLSDDARDKLPAVLSANWPGPDDDLGANYREACWKWFAGLFEWDKSIVARVGEVYADGNEKRAARVASQLPPALAFPLHEDN